MKEFKEYARSSRKSLDIEQLVDVKLPVSMILGHRHISIRDLLNMEAGTVLKLDRVAGENVDLVVNKRNLAKGEVVVINNCFGFRLVTLLSPEERLKGM